MSSLLGSSEPSSFSQHYLSLHVVLLLDTLDLVVDNVGSKFRSKYFRRCKLRVLLSSYLDGSNRRRAINPYLEDVHRMGDRCLIWATLNQN